LHRHGEGAVARCRFDPKRPFHPDSVNQLINPIDQSVITTDVYGDPRTSGGFRNAGAVQQVTDVPEIDPQSLGSAAAFILGALGMTERRRLQARLRRA